MILCPKCKRDIDIEEEELEEGELVSCLECDGDFEVASVEPFKLTTVKDAEEAGIKLPPIVPVLAYFLIMVACFHSRSITTAVNSCLARSANVSFFV